jgi:hypothetical protein
MTDRDAKTSTVWTEKAPDITDAYAGSDRETEGDVVGNGAEQRQRPDRAVLSGRNSSPSRRPRPVTHGKTLGYLITAAQGRIARIDRTIESLKQQIELLQQEREAENAGLEDLQQALADWEGRVASLSKVTSIETEAEHYDPAEELTA